jgi:hypothetical protein
MNFNFGIIHFLKFGELFFYQVFAIVVFEVIFEIMDTITLYLPH